MAPKLRPTRGGTTHALDDLYNRLQANPDDADALAELEEIQRDIDLDDDYRFGSVYTHKRQDLHLMRFVKAMRVCNHDTPGYKDLSDDEVINKEITNAGKANVVANMRRYLRFEAHKMIPTSHLDDRPRYQSLASCRNSMIHWIFFYQKGKAPGMEQLLYAANQTLRSIGFNTKPRSRTYSGRVEFAQLVDWDTTHAASLPLAESHHLAWCLACVCGVRPGAIGTTKGHRDQFLTFRDIEVTRAREIGFFNIKIVFRYLKANRENLTEAKPLTFYINGAATIDFLPLSIPHRLLVMLLRREGLQDHSDLDSLRNGKEQLIKIKPGMLDQPVCRAGDRGDLSAMDEPVTATNLTAYISRVAKAAGYPCGITMYSWRHKVFRHTTMACSP